MQLLETTRIQQSALAGFCRTGLYTPIEGVNEKNVLQYRRLVYNVVDDTLVSAYPLTHNLLSPKEWNRLVTDFFASHPCKSPQVWSMPKELWEWVKDTSPAVNRKYPFLEELLWFEWLEVELFMMENKTVAHRKFGDIRKDKLVINPEHHLQYFNYPVHLKNAKYITPTDKGNYFLVMHREPETGKINFTKLSPFLVRMLEMLAEKPSAVNELTDKISKEFRVIKDKAVKEKVQEFVENAITGKLILGFI